MFPSAYEPVVIDPTVVDHWMVFEEVPSKTFRQKWSEKKVVFTWDYEGNGFRKKEKKFLKPGGPRSKLHLHANGRERISEKKGLQSLVVSHQGGLLSKLPIACDMFCQRKQDFACKYHVTYIKQNNGFGRSDLGAHLGLSSSRYGRTQSAAQP